MYREENIYKLLASMIELCRRDIRKGNAYAYDALEFLAWAETELAQYLLR